MTRLSLTRETSAGRTSCHFLPRESWFQEHLQTANLTLTLNPSKQAETVILKITGSTLPICRQVAFHGHWTVSGCLSYYQNGEKPRQQFYFEDTFHYCDKKHTVLSYAVGQACLSTWIPTLDRIGWIVNVTCTKKEPWGNVLIKSPDVKRQSR